MKLLHIIADYAAGDLAFSEMISALATHLPDDYKWHPTAVHSFDTVACGFIVAQLGLQAETLRAPSTLIYANCAPRKDRATARANNSGEGVLFGRLKNGVPILVVNSGHSLSFVREDLTELWEVNVSRAGSQFRSRDIFPPVVGKIARGEIDFLKNRVEPTEVIPPIPRQVVAYVDSFGNLKTTLRDGQDPILKTLKEGQRFGVQINKSRPITVTVATGSFNVSEGDFAFAPGSSGHDRRYWEIFQRGASAWETFGRPMPGSEIVLNIE